MLANPDLNIKSLDKSLLRVLSDLGVGRSREDLLDWSDKRGVDEDSPMKKIIEADLKDG